MTSLVILSELKNLLPPLSEQEYAGLEADILEHGCLSPIVVWNETIVDGHNRYEICEKHGISFEVKPLEFASLDEARFWAWTHQENRRNLTPYQRTTIALQFKPMLAAKAKKKEFARKSTLLNSAKSDKEYNTRQELADIADVSQDTVSRVEFLEKYADEETKQRLRDGDTTINREYTRLKNGASDEDSLLPILRESSEYQGCITLRHILMRDTDSLVSCLFSMFDASYRERLILDVLRKAQVDDGPETVETIVHKINQEFPISLPLH